MNPIEAESLTKDYGEGRGVFGLDLVVEPGQVYGFLGPNGAGKTTVMRLLVGLLRPTSGVARLFGERAGDPRGLRNVGALIESPSLYGGLTGRQNLRYFAQLAAVDRRRVDKVLDEVSLTSSADRRFSSYSLGMKQRLGVAVALLKDPQLLMLDEPTNGLDPEGLVEMRALISSVRESGHTVFLSSHQMSEVENLCDRVAVLDHGRVVAEDTVEGILQRTGHRRYNLRTRDIEAATDFIKGEQRIHGHGPIDNGLWLAVDDQSVPDVIRSLVGHGVAINEIFAEPQSLEAAFFDIVKTSSLGESQ